MAKPNPLKKDRTNRQAELKEHPFMPYLITPETAHTAILLLLSKENEILCQTLRSLTKFCDPIDSNNREVTFNLEAIKYTLPHIDSSEINIKRFGLKLLAQMSQMPRGPEQIIENPMNIRKVATILATSQDLFVLEFASLVLAECSKEPVGCDQVVLANILGVLLNKVKECIDPDVQKNCLQVLQNLLDDPVASKEITKNPQFNWAPLFELMKSPYPAIQQSTLQVIKQLLSRYNDQIVQKTFKTSTGIPDLCTMLELYKQSSLLAIMSRIVLALPRTRRTRDPHRASANIPDALQKRGSPSSILNALLYKVLLKSYEFRDMHTLVLSVLKTFIEAEDNAAFFYQSGNVQKILDYLDLALPVIKVHVLSVLAKMSNSFNGRAALYETGTDLIFCHYLLGSTNEVIADSAYGVANMCKMWASAVRMADTNIVDAITNTLVDENAAWFDTRMNCLLALTVIASIVNKVATAVVEQKNFNALRNINRKPNTPIEAQRLATQCFINLLNFSVSTKAMVNIDFISEVISSLQRTDVELKILLTKLLTGLAVEEVAKYILTKRKAESVINVNLRIEHVGLRTALCEYIIASVTEENADIYLGLGTIQYMIQCKKVRYKVPAWESAIETLLRHHLSAKFAYTGRVEVTDITPEGFYVMKRLGDSFETMASLLEDAGDVADDVNPVLIVNFLPSLPERASAGDIRSPYRNSHSKLNLHSPRVALADDSNLRTYLLQLRIWFGDPSKSLQYLEYEDAHYEIRYREKCKEVSTSLKSRAQLLGEYVAEQMCGLTQERDCSLPSVEIHLADLMLEMRQRVIGLGFVKCGAALERAILYKVLADRVGLPCSLHRTASAHAWVEVAVPEIDPEKEVADERYPAGLLRENYIVDLMDNPGKLIPVTSREAKRICGPSCSPRYVSGPPPSVCKCVPSGQPQQT